MQLNTTAAERGSMQLNTTAAERGSMQLNTTAAEVFCLRPHFRKNEREFSGIVRYCLHNDKGGYLQRVRGPPVAR
jgi:hypothetical protein